MYVIAGLGNPGREYVNTRHNMGFLALDEIAMKLGVDVRKIKCKALIGEGRYNGEKVLLVKPQTYMNDSGLSLREVMAYYDVPMSNLIVIYDDMDTEPGRIKIKTKGSAGAHNGMKSIIYHLQDDRFPRVRIGIGKPEVMDWKDFVLGKVGEKEAGPLADGIRAAADAVISILDIGIQKTMNKYNTDAEAAAKVAERREASRAAKEQD